MDCFHHCRAHGGHFWSHIVSDPSSKIDQYRLFCDEHAKEIADKLLEGTLNDNRTEKRPTDRENTGETTGPHGDAGTKGWNSDRFTLHTGEAETEGSIRGLLALAQAASDDATEMQILRD